MQKKVIPVIINKGNWNNLKIVQKIRKQHTGKARHQETTTKKKQPILHHVHTSESANV
jgi:hypothetical protein